MGETRLFTGVNEADAQSDHPPHAEHSLRKSGAATPLRYMPSLRVRGQPYLLFYCCLTVQQSELSLVKYLQKESYMQI